MRRNTRAVALCAVLGLAAPAAVAQAVDQRPQAAALAASGVPGGRIEVVVKGERFGRRAPVTVVGITGKAKGWTATLKVKTSKTVIKVQRPGGAQAKPLPSGKYRVTGDVIDKTTEAAIARRVVVKVSSGSGARAVLRYEATKQDPSDEPTAPPSPSPTPPPAPVDSPPGPVAALKTGKITGTTVKLEWTLPDDADLDQILVRRAQGATAPVSASDGVEVDLPFKAADFTTDVGLNPKTDYSYSVFSRDDAGNTTGPVSLTTATQQRGILAAARSGSGATSVATATVVDEDNNGGISEGDVVLLGSVATTFDAATTAGLTAGPLTVKSVVTASRTECSLRHGDSPQNVMTFREDAAEQSWIDAGAAATTTLTDRLVAGADDVISVEAGSPTRPGVDVVRQQPAGGDAPFIDVFAGCKSN